MSADFADGIAKASQTIQSYTYPLLRVGDNALPEVFASCVFLEIAGSVYLVTAAHAIRGNPSGLLTRGSGHLIDVTGQANISRSEGKDHFDIAAIRMDEQTIRQHAISVISQRMFSTSVEVLSPHSRAICGFPVSMNKQVHSLDRDTKTFTGKCYTYFGTAVFGGDFSAFAKSSTVHVGLEYLPGTDDTGRVMSSPPSPRGISGGGAWLVPDLSHPQLVFLEGIVIECHKRARKMYVFSTRLEHVIDFINQTHKVSVH